MWPFDWWNPKGSKPLAGRLSGAIPPETDVGWDGDPGGGAGDACCDPFGVVDWRVTGDPGSLDATRG
jgi:hypothetical protein